MKFSTEQLPSGAEGERYAYRIAHFGGHDAYDAMIPIVVLPPGCHMKTTGQTYCIEHGTHFIPSRGSYLYGNADKKPPICLPRPVSSPSACDLSLSAVVPTTGRSFRPSKTSCHPRAASWRRWNYGSEFRDSHPPEWSTRVSYGPRCE